jgi:L-alanine-DL-glutamate epimerase-like enolase superfamily enzyme
LRKKYGNKITLRVDANGAFDFPQAKNVLKDLKKLDIHSIEQPLATENWEEMSELCALNIVPIALDEELIGIFDGQSKFSLLEYIAPQFIILKPTLLGGFAQTLSWIKIAKSLKIGFWLTSALESNIGLNAIAQFTAEIYKNEKNIPPQGLGTGALYENNFPTKLLVNAGQISIADVSA